MFEEVNHNCIRNCCWK